MIIPAVFSRVQEHLQVSRPPVRRIVVSRSCEDVGCSWEVIGSVPFDAVAFLDADAKHPPSRLQYRVTNWSTFGRCVAVLRPVLQSACDAGSERTHHVQLHTH